MLETIDYLITNLINQHYGYALDDIIFAPEEYSLRARAEKIKADNKVLPFVSYYRVAEPDWERYRKILVAGRGVPIGKNETTGDTIFGRMMPIKLNYNIVFWEKNAVTINTILKNHIFKAGRITELVFQYSNQDVRLNADWGDLEYANRVPDFGNFLKNNLIYNASFKLSTNAFIFEEDANGDDVTSELGTIEKIIVTIGLSKDDTEKKTIEIVPPTP